MVGSATTDGLGRAVVSLGDNDGHIDALIEFKGKYVLVPRIVLVEAATSRILSSLVFDKAIVKPSESLHIKGTTSSCAFSSVSCADQHLMILWNK